MTQLTLDNACDSPKPVGFDQILLLCECDNFHPPCLKTSKEEALRCSSAIR
jgi:hypothetical protein